MTFCLQFNIEDCFTLNEDRNSGVFFLMKATMSIYFSVCDAAFLLNQVLAIFSKNVVTTAVHTARLA